MPTEHENRSKAVAKQPRQNGSKFLPKWSAPEKQEMISAAVERFNEGEKLTAIAKDLGMNHQTLYSWLLDEVPQQYRGIQRRAIISRLAETYEKLEVAKDALELTRARELRKASQWDAERRLPALFSEKGNQQAPEITIVINKLGSQEEIVINPKE